MHKYASVLFNLMALSLSKLFFFYMLLLLRTDVPAVSKSENRKENDRKEQKSQTEQKALSEHLRHLENDQKNHKYIGKRHQKQKKKPSVIETDITLAVIWSKDTVSSRSCRPLSNTSNHSPRKVIYVLRLSSVLSSSIFPVTGNRYLYVCMTYSVLLSGNR